MKNIFIILFLLITLNSCELIVIGQKPSEVKTIIVSRNNPTGTVLLLKSELENDNIYAASDFFATPSGHKYKAADKLDLFDNLPMLSNRIKLLNNVTSITEEKLDNDIIKVKIEYEYIKYFICDTKKIDSLFYVINYSFQKYEPNLNPKK